MIKSNLERMSSLEEFWLDNPGHLFRQVTILPNADMTEEERLNSMTRLIIIVTIILFLVGVGSWFLFLILGIVLVIALFWANVTNKPEPEPPTEEGDSDAEGNIENYTCNSHLIYFNKEARIKPAYCHTEIP